MLGAVEDAMGTAEELFGGGQHWPELRELVERAETLAGNDADDAYNIHALSEAWVAEETTPGYLHLLRFAVFR